MNHTRGTDALFFFIHSIYNLSKGIIMTIEAIAKLINRKPFIPVCLHLQNHNRIDVMHPELVIVARDGLYVSEPVPNEPYTTSPRVIGYENIVTANLYEPGKEEAA